MTLSRTNLYLIIFASSVAGYIWIFYNISNNLIENKSFSVCLIKHITNIPCPSCGSTRSVLLLISGNFIQALKINPLGLFVAFVMITFPLWIIADTLTKKSTFFDSYKKMELYLKRPIFSLPLILLVIINWIWNIIKEL